MAAAASCASSGGASALAEVVEARARRSEGPSRGVDQSDDRPASDDPADPREPAAELPAHAPERALGARREGHQQLVVLPRGGGEERSAGPESAATGGGGGGAGRGGLRAGAAGAGGMARRLGRAGG